MGREEWLLASSLLWRRQNRKGGALGWGQSHSSLFTLFLNTKWAPDPRVETMYSAILNSSCLKDFVRKRDCSWGASQPDAVNKDPSKTIIERNKPPIVSSSNPPPLPLATVVCRCTQRFHSPSLTPGGGETHRWRNQKQRPDHHWRKVSRAG